MNRKLLINAMRAAAAVGIVAIAVPLAAGPLRVMAAVNPPGKAVILPPPAVDLPATAGRQTIVLSGGCFWGVQGVFQHVKGVEKAISGYAGGKAATAIYEVVGSGTTGHAESVEVTFDPKQIPLGEILRIFFSVATDPTQLNMQFPDEGTQYRSEIFYNTPDQKRVAQAYIAQLNAAKAFPRPIVTRVDPNTGFFPAESYHQDYLTLHPDQPYIATYDIPKIAALRKTFPARYQAKPVLVGKRT